MAHASSRCIVDVDLATVLSSGCDIAGVGLATELANGDHIADADSAMALSHDHDTADVDSVRAPLNAAGTAWTAQEMPRDT